VRKLVNPDREILLDVSRLVWRVWSGRLPTGVDRVCLAYLKQFRDRSQAVIYRGGWQILLSPAQSDRLYRLLLDGHATTASDLLFFVLVFAWRGVRRTVARRGLLYLNVGHTALNEPSLPNWIAINGLRAVYLIHDLIPLTHPEFCRPGEAKKHSERIRNVLTSASGVIGNSQATIDDLAAFAKSEDRKMPPHVVAWIAGYTARAAKPKTLGRPYFVTVGTIEGRKNHLLLLQVWHRLVANLGESAPILVIVGQRGWEADRAFEMLDQLGDLEGSVLELGTCGDDELADWLAGARALLMPSFTEGFGLPVIESLEVGTPVIASDLPVYREIVGSIPTYLDPLDPDAWSRSIQAFLDNATERERQKTQVTAYRAPTWERHFQIVEAWLKRL
jgi:glycosyltransferase involved in cell wall biosynthesis